MKSKELFISFVTLTTAQTGLTTIAIWKGLSYCMLGVLPFACLYLGSAMAGFYLIGRSVKSISKLISYNR